MDTATRLITGNKMPRLGFGTWQLADGEQAEHATTRALEVGYRLIDTAKLYGNEASVGRAVRASGVPRKDIFITTKVWNSDQGYDSTLKAFDASMKRLKLDYVDLYLIHWPATDMRGETWRALQTIKKQGGARDIGVSNYTIRHLRELLEDFGEVPAVNQIEFHPYIYREQKPLLDFCAEYKIAVEAYSPLAHAHGLKHPSLIEIAEERHKSPAQVMLRWAIQHGTIPIPKSSHAGRIAENFEVFDFELEANEMKKINKLSDGTRVTWDTTGLP